MHLVLDVGPQRHHGALHGDVEQPGLQPDQQRGNQIQPERQQQRAADRAEVDAAAGDHVHPRQQIGEGAVATGAGRLDGLLLGQTRGQLAADHAVEQQVGGVAEDPRADHADRDAGDPEQEDQRRQPPLRREPFDQPQRRTPEVAGPLCRGLHHAADGARHRPGHCEPPMPAPIDWESANSA